MPEGPRRFDPLLGRFPNWSTPPDVRLRPRISPPVPLPTEGRDREQTRPVDLPPWLFPPALHFPIDLPINRVLVLVAAGGTLLIVWPAVPQGATGVVRRIGVQSNDFANTRITTRINSNPVPPYGGIVGTVGDLTTPLEMGPIILRPGDIFSLLLENIGGAGFLMAGRTVGWWY